MTTKTKKKAIKVTKTKKPDYKEAYKVSDLVRVTEAINKLLDTYSSEDFTDMGQALLDVANTVPQNRIKWAHKKIHDIDLVLIELSLMGYMRKGIGCSCKDKEDY